MWREPFRCNEPEHGTRERRANREHGGGGNLPKVRWLPIAAVAERGAEWPVCCGQVMELLPGDEADRLRAGLSRNKAGHLVYDGAVPSEAGEHEHEHEQEGDDT